MSNDVGQLVGHLFRLEAGKMTAVLTRMLGFEHFERAEDIVQDTLLKALSVWKIKGVPDNPSAWLYTVARRQAIDYIREQRIHNTIHTEIASSIHSEWTLTPAVNQMFLENEIEDSQLRMIFACCHPAIPYESQLALTLKTLCGLSVGEIARNFLTNEETITKRLFRAREKIREENIKLEPPSPSTLSPRLEAVLHSIYLLFSEGYHSSHADKLIRDEFCEEAIRLCLLLTKNALTNVPVTNALLALMCFQASRSEARLDQDGEVVLMKDQNRELWNRALIEKAKYFLNLASEGDVISVYHLEAMIAACHAEAKSFEETNWYIIIYLYDALLNLAPNPIIAMNRAIAMGFCFSPEIGLDALLKIEELKESHIYKAALGDFYLKSGNIEKSIQAYRCALDLTKSKTDRRLLEEKLEIALEAESKR